MKNIAKKNISATCSDIIFLMEKVNLQELDYTKWREKYFENATSENFQNSAVEYSKKNPLFVKKNRVCKIFSVFFLIVFCIIR